MAQGLIYSIISAFAFGSMAILVKLGYNAGLGGNEMMQYRFTYAIAILAFYLFIKDRSLLRISFRDLGKCAIIGMVVYWAQTTCFVRGLATIPASTAALVLYVYPVTVTLLSAIFLKMKIDRLVAISLSLVIGGSCLVFYDAFLKSVDATGLMYATGAMVVFSTYLVLVQVLLKGIKPMTATLYVMSFAALSFNLSGTPEVWLSPSRDAVLIGFALGLLPGVIAVTTLYLAIEKVGSAYASIFSSIEPVVTLAGAAMFLSEEVVMLQISGAALIIVGIVLPNLRALQIRKRLQKR